MRQMEPGKTFIEAPTAGEGATCRSCAHCPWMGMNALDNLEATLISGDNEVLVDPAIAARAVMPLERMVQFAEGGG